MVKSFGDLHVELLSLQVVNGNQYLLTMSIANPSQKSSLWVGLSCDMGNNLKAKLTDANGFEFVSDWSCVSGIDYTFFAQYGYQGAGFYKATEIRPNDSITATVKFISRVNRTASAGQCSLQMEFLSGHDFSGGFGHCTAQNLVCNIEAEDRTEDSKQVN